MRPMLDNLGLILLLALSGCPNGNEGGESGSTSCKNGSCGPCLGAASTPILKQDGSPTGYETCADGSVHRVSVGTANPEIVNPSCAGTEDYQQCTADAECTDHPNGKCISGTMVDGPETTCGCAYSCSSDADCDTGFACMPPEVVQGVANYPICVPAQCKTDSECASGECGVSSWDNGCGLQVSLVCRSGADTCRVSGDCSTEQGCGVDFNQTSYQCNEGGCAIGRPLLVEGEARVAPSRSRRDWMADLQPVRLAELDRKTRAILADHWKTVAALEHASVGSFARFSMQLLAIGAPADLLAETQQAAADEVRHARMAYALAAAYAGTPVGPGPLDLGNAPLLLDWESILRGLVAEACVGETLGAAEAAAAAAGCADPVVKEILDGIAVDEARHAALAWRCLGWMLKEAPEHRDWVREALVAAMHDISVGDEPAFPELGVPGSEARRALHAQLQERVLAPLSAVLAA